MAFVLAPWLLFRRRETAEDVVHRVVTGAIEEAVARASSRWADWEFSR